MIMELILNFVIILEECSLKIKSNYNKFNLNKQALENLFKFMLIILKQKRILWH
jgi:hypothetical protein